MRVRAGRLIWPEVRYRKEGKRERRSVGLAGEGASLLVALKAKPLVDTCLAAFGA